MARIRHAVKEFAAFFNQHVGDMVRDHYAADGQISRRKSFCDRHEIRLKIVIVTSKPLAGTPKTADYFIGDQKNLMTLTDGADLRPVAVGRYDDSTGPLYGFSDERGHSMLAQLFYFLLELMRHFLSKFFWREIAALVVPKGLIDVNDVGNR